MLRSEVEINIDQWPQQTFNNENPWLNFIIAHTKFIPRIIVCLFSTNIPIFASATSPLIETTTAEINTRDTRQSVDQIVVDLLVYASAHEKRRTANSQVTLHIHSTLQVH